MKLSYGLTRHMNTYISQQFFPIYMQLKQDTPIPGEDNNALETFEPYKDEKSILEKQNIERDYKNLVGKSSDIEICTKNSLSKRISQDRLLASKLSSFLREVRFNEQESLTDKLVLDIKYYHLGSQKNNSFHPFNDQLDYTHVTSFAEFETTKGNVNRFLSNLLIFLFTKKLSYQNANKWIEKLSDILWGIPNNKQINHKFELQNNMGGIAR